MGLLLQFYACIQKIACSNIVFPKDHLPPLVEMSAVIWLSKSYSVFCVLISDAIGPMLNLLCTIQTLLSPQNSIFSVDISIILAFLI